MSYASHFPHGRFLFRDIEPYQFSPPITGGTRSFWLGRARELRREVQAGGPTPNRDLLNKVTRESKYPAGYRPDNAALQGLPMRFNALQMLSASRGQYTRARMSRATVAKQMGVNRPAQTFSNPLLEATRLYQGGSEYGSVNSFLGGLAGLGDVDAGGGVKFKNADAAKDFFNGKGLNSPANAYGVVCDARGGVFRPIPANTMQQINERLGMLASGYDPSGYERWSTAAASLIAEVDRLQTHDDPVSIVAFVLPWETGPQLAKCGRTEGRERAYLAALNRLKAHYLLVMSIPMSAPPPTTELPAMPSASSYSTPTSAVYNSPTLPDAGNYASFFTAGGSSGSGALLAQRPAIPWVPIAIGGGVLALGAAVLLLKKR